MTSGSASPSPLRSSPAAAAARRTGTRAAARAVAAARTRVAAAARGRVVPCARRAFGPRGAIPIELSRRLGTGGGATLVGRRRGSAIARRRRRRSAPRPVVVFLPAAVLAPIDVAVAAGVVPGAVAVGRIERVVRGIEAAVPDIRRVVPAAAPHGAAPRDHHPGVAGRRGERHPLVVVVVLDDGDVGHVVRRRARRNLVNRVWYRAGGFPWPLRAPGDEPHALEAHVVEIA